MDYEGDIAVDDLELITGNCIGIKKEEKQDNCIEVHTTNLQLFLLP